MRKLNSPKNIKAYHEIKEVMDDSDDLTKDVATEVLDELFNPKYVTDEERVTGILEAITFITKVKTK